MDTLYIGIGNIRLILRILWYDLSRICQIYQWDIFDIYVSYIYMYRTNYALNKLIKHVLHNLV